MTTSTRYQEVVPRRTARHEVRGIDYHANEWGEPRDPLLVLLHGWGDCGASFQFLVDSLAEDWFVVAPDWRGFGESGGNDGGAYWFPDYLADLDALLDIYSPESPARLVGHSMGANAAALYAGVFPERVSALVNIEGFGLPESDPEQAPANYRRWIDTLRQERCHPGFSGYDELVAKILKRSPRMSIARAHFVARAWTTAADDGSVRLNADPAHRWPNAVLYRRREAEACWRGVRAPVLAVIGAESGVGDDAGVWLHGGEAGTPFPDLTVARIADAGHMLHFEQPARLAQVVEDFLRPLAFRTASCRV